MTALSGGRPLEPCVLVLKRAVLHRGGRAARMARAGHATARRILPAAEEPACTVAAVEEALRRRGIAFVRVPVDAIDRPVRRRLARARLVVTVGGDGTLLAASHPVTDAALLGVNGAPGDSVGHFCATDRRGFETWLRARRIQFRIRELYREPGRRYRLAAGFVEPARPVVVESKMDEGFLFIDGARSAYRFPFGSRVEVRTAVHPLRLFVKPPLVKPAQ